MIFCKNPKFPSLQTNEEYKKLFLGYQMHNDTDGNDDFYTDEDVSALPYRIDWRAFGYVTDVKRQVRRGRKAGGGGGDI